MIELGQNIIATRNLVIQGISKLKAEGVRLELETAEVNHCGAPEMYYKELIQVYELESGTYDIKRYLTDNDKLPDDRYMGSIYARLIIDLVEQREEKLLSVFMEVQ